jgi:hypothetical protein
MSLKNKITKAGFTFVLVHLCYYTIGHLIVRYCSVSVNYMQFVSYLLAFYIASNQIRKRNNAKNSNSIGVWQFMKYLFKTGS